MGVEINAQQTEDSEYVNTVNRITLEVHKRILAPWLYSDFIYYLSCWRKTIHKCGQPYYIDFSNQVIRDRKQHYRNIKTGQNHEDVYLGKRKKMAFLDLLLECSENGGNLTDEEIREEVDTFMFEGHDTTSVAICWTLYHISNHPDCQEKIYEELQSILGDSDRSPTIMELNEMKYLERVIKESLRVHPSVPLIGRILKQDVQIDGYTLPEGLILTTIIPSIHHDEETFPDPEEFNPDNFLPERVAARHPYAYIPFSAGPRNCIGQKFAILEEKMILSYIIRRYKLHSSGIESLPGPDIILRSQNGFHIKITPR
ncbi:hypothetical protein L9F63_026022 [Diploptera punctata]|uniref:Cytochrome P450 n=1 Tax=Diploptera punctata TaxID=6984 RepID=A0AAD8E2Q9_DIPPU|nr:hypothetical protein L9F63_026022 [Diploptera punctata]